jgi:tRNA modification GTPase
MMQLPGAADTIVALATAPGRGAIALVRVSGSRAMQVVQACLNGAAGVGTEISADSAAFVVSGLEPRRATLRTVCHPVSGDVVDRALITWFPAPHSYTGDNVVEISTHGGYVVPAAVIGALLAAGAREALPGEFTRRALMAGKMDLLQAEAVADLVDARSSALHRVALEQFDGGLSRRLLALRSECLQLEALLAYDIDFPEEDDGPIDPARIGAAVSAVIAALDVLLATAPAVPMLREGAIVVLAGVPNAGKSSLFNALIGEARAIVTEVPGTTRDALDVLIDSPLVPIRLVDTAGLRETDDRVERLGIEVSARWLQRAHLVLACGETVADVEATVRAVGEAGAGAVPVVRVLTKQDGGELQQQTQLLDAENAEHAEDAESLVRQQGFVVTSAESGLGLGRLLEVVQAKVAKEYGVVAPDVPRLTRERHHVAVRTAREELAAFVDAWDVGRGVPAIIAAVHVRAAVHALDELIGAVSLDDVLDRLFREFCVGK